VVDGDELGDGRRLVELVTDDVMDQVGTIPLPPYIHADLDDPDRYQTVFARHPGSVAAPTAGLHLTPPLLDRIRDRGAEVVAVELRVGLGTFRPVTADKVADHVMHAETYRIDGDAWSLIGSARRLVAVGTTVVRALESAAATGRLAGSTDLFIRRGFDWQVVDTLLTNFHVPRSSLLVLVDALIGPRWAELYEIALAGDYRFLSFGDAMLVDRRR
jgi:S-adenosylmethionine:tRNA ribosyltransferase-isomerase